MWKPCPSFDLENSWSPFSLIAGGDEVGYGPWAGPVVCAIVVFEPSLKEFPPEWFTSIKDSKLLTKKKREYLYDHLTNHPDIAYGVGQCGVEEIDQLNILRATHLALKKALHEIPKKPQAILVDGNRAPDLGIPCQTIVRGDQQSYSIAAASIISKVTRDRMMATLAKEFHQYGWETNVGYGTRAHHEAILKHGVTPHHRRSFAPIQDALQGHLRSSWRT